MAQVVLREVRSTDTPLPVVLQLDLRHVQFERSRLAPPRQQHQRQLDVARDIAEQIRAGGQSIFGVMVESHLHDGAQKFSPGKDDPAKLDYGKSITDACLGWDASLEVLQVLNEVHFVVAFCIPLKLQQKCDKMGVLRFWVVFTGG